MEPDQARAQPCSLDAPPQRSPQPTRL